MTFKFYIRLLFSISILIKISLQKVDLGEDYNQKVQENFKKRSTSDAIWGSILMGHPLVIT